MSPVLLVTFAVAFTVYIYMEKIMSDAVANLTAAVAANTAAVNAAVERLTSAPPAGIEPSVVQDAANAIEANNAALNAALSAAFAPPEPSPETMTAKGKSFSA